MNYATDQAKLDDAIQSLRGLLDRLQRIPRVLVIEDDNTDWELLARDLKEFRCEVVRANDGPQAIEFIKNEEWDFILLDQKLPTMPGDLIMEATTGMRRHARVFVVTGYPGSSQAEQALRKGAILTIPKPVTKEALQVFLRSYAEP